MGRPPVTDGQRERGRRLGRAIQMRRESAGLTQSELCQAARVDLDWFRRLEQGRVASPSWFGVVALYRELKLRCNELEKEIQENMP